MYADSKEWQTVEEQAYPPAHNWKRLLVIYVGRSFVQHQSFVQIYCTIFHIYIYIIYTISRYLYTYVAIAHWISEWKFSWQRLPPNSIDLFNIPRNMLRGLLSRCLETLLQFLHFVICGFRPQPDHTQKFFVDHDMHILMHPKICWLGPPLFHLNIGQSICFEYISKFSEPARLEEGNGRRSVTKIWQGWSTQKKNVSYDAFGVCRKSYIRSFSPSSSEMLLWSLALIVLRLMVSCSPHCRNPPGSNPRKEHWLLATLASVLIFSSRWIG